jgi:hypothetical protein
MPESPMWSAALHPVAADGSGIQWVYTATGTKPLSAYPRKTIEDIGQYKIFAPAPRTPADCAAGKDKMQFLCCKVHFLMIYAHMSPTFGELG